MVMGDLSVWFSFSDTNVLSLFWPPEGSVVTLGFLGFETASLLSENLRGENVKLVCVSL